MKRLIRFAENYTDIDPKKFVEYLKELTGISSNVELSNFLGYSQNYIWNLSTSYGSSKITSGLMIKIQDLVPGFSLDGYNEFANKFQPSVEQNSDLNDIDPKKFVEYLKQLTNIASNNELSSFLGYSNNYIHNLSTGYGEAKVNEKLIDSVSRAIPEFSLYDYYEFASSNI